MHLQFSTCMVFSAQFWESQELAKYFHDNFGIFPVFSQCPAVIILYTHPMYNSCDLMHTGPLSVSFSFRSVPVAAIAATQPLRNLERVKGLSVDRVNGQRRCHAQSRWICCLFPLLATKHRYFSHQFGGAKVIVDRVDACKSMCVCVCVRLYRISCLIEGIVS